MKVMGEEGEGYGRGGEGYGRVREGVDVVLGM